MANQITQAQYNTAHQTIRNTYVRVNLLNFQFLTVDSLEGNLISGSISIDANSDIRRTCNLDLVVTDSSFKVEAGGKIWLDKFVQIYVGVDDIHTGETAWTNMGIFLINQPTYNYDAVTHTLSFQGVDLTAKLTGMRNGYITGLASEDKVVFTVGQNIRELIIGILKETGFKNYVVSECRNVDGTIQDVPYEMEFDQGSTWWDALMALRDILPSYQMYFDVDGVFHYDMIPYSANNPIRIDLNTWDNNAISETVAVDFEAVKNSVEVYGVVHEPSFFCESDKVTISGAEIALEVAETFELEEYQLVGFVLPSDVSGNITININNGGAKKLVNSARTRITSLAADTYWTITYTADGEWLFLGHAQAQAKWKDENPNSPFYIGGTLGEIYMPLYGGDYDNIQSDELALERAKYEIYLRCRLNDSINVTTVPIYWADVGWKVNYRPLDGNTINQYLVQSINIDLQPDGNQTWNLSRFYPLYESF